MIRENEIRINNWFHHKAEWSYRQGTEELLEFDFEWNDMDWWALGECTLSLENIEPIVLTEKWILKSKFKKAEFYEKTKYDIGINEHHFSLSKVGDVYDHWYLYKGENKLITSIIRYVHQLQNIHFDLTNEEL